MRVRFPALDNRLQVTDVTSAVCYEVASEGSGPSILELVLVCRDCVLHVVSYTVGHAVVVVPSLCGAECAVGIGVAIGAGVGIAGRWLWCFLELQQPNERFEGAIKRITAADEVMVFSCCVWKLAHWQSSIRSLMEMEPLQSAAPASTVLIAPAIGVLLVTAARTA